MCESIHQIESAVSTAILRLLEDGQAQHAHLLGLGEVAELEAKLRAWYGAKYAVATSSATAGLMAVALALGLQNEEFITTPFTYGASLASWLLLRSRPLFADLTSGTRTLDPESARQAITSRTRAILAVDIFGNPCDMVGLRRLADQFGLWFISDAAQSLGALRNRRPASCLADAWIVSFTSQKPLFAGEGGAVLTNNRDLYERVLWFSQHPERHRRELGLHLDNEFGLNGRIHPLAAAWANAAFDRAIAQVRVRQSLSLRILDMAKSTNTIYTTPYSVDGILPSFFRLAVVLRKQQHPRVLISALMAEGINARMQPSSVRLIYRNPAFLSQYSTPGMKDIHCPVAEATAGRCYFIDADASDGASLTGPQIGCPTPGLGGCTGRQWEGT